MFPEYGPWIVVSDGDERVFNLYKRHYSYKPYKDNRRQIGYRNRFLICGPGEKLVLLSGDEKAAFSWLLMKDNDAGEEGLYCSFFRNESDCLSSFLILEAEKVALAKWPLVTRFYTYIDPKEVKPTKRRGVDMWGYCYLKAGWQQCDYITKWNHKLVFEKVLK